MIKKLRRKFVLIVLCSSAAILLTVFMVLLFSTHRGLVQQEEEMLDMALASASRKNGLPSPQGEGMGPGRGPGGEDLMGEKQGKHANRFPSFTAVIDSEGTVTLKEGELFFLSGEYTQEEIEALAVQAAEAPQDEGVMTAYRLRYKRMSQENNTLVAFADTSRELTTMRELIKNALLVGAAALLALFFCSVLLARWAVKPVETAWNQQKRFVGDASHELKTPLTVILSNADMLLSHPGEEGTRWAENIKAEGVRMKRLTEELLSLARTDDPERRPVMEKVDLSYLVTDCILSFEAAAFEGGHALKSRVEENLFVLGDDGGLAQLTSILLENAIQYASPGGEILAALENDGKFARLSVANPGDPIPKEELSRIFQRFTRGDPSRHSGQGHGLGLSIAQNIALAHKGKIWAESENGKTTFTVLLPKIKLDQAR